MNRILNRLKFNRQGASLVALAGIFCLVILSKCGTGSNAGENKPASSPNDTASIVFYDYEHDFGKVTEGETVAYLFTYTNRGNAPLVISSASTSCGCTVSKYSTKPLAPGKKGTMEVTFDTSGRSGKQTKTITVSSNATKSIVLLKITCEVINNNNK